MPPLALPGELREAIEGDPDVALMAAYFLRGAMMRKDAPADPTRLRAERILRESGQGPEIAAHLERVHAQAIKAAGDGRRWRERMNHLNAARGYVRHLALRARAVNLLGMGTLTTPELAEALDAPRETARAVMNYLLEAGEVEREREGPSWRWALARAETVLCSECGRPLPRPALAEADAALARAIVRQARNGRPETGHRSIYPAPDRGGYP